MKQAIVAAACIALIAVGGCEKAFAGSWHWGCAGPVGDKALIFTRYDLIILPAKTSRPKLRDLIFLDDLSKKFDDVPQYGAADVNSGLQQKMEFSRTDDEKDKVVLTEKSSKTMSHHTAIVCGRDEDTAVSRKVFSYHHNDEPPRDITLQCMEYMLTSRGGRPCINRP